MTVRAKAKHNVVLTRPHPTEKGKNVRIKVKAGTHYDFTEKEFKELNKVNPGLLARKGESDIEPARPAGMPVVSETGNEIDGAVGGKKKPAPEPDADDDAGDDAGDAGEGDAGDDEDDL